MNLSVTATERLLLLIAIAPLLYLVTVAIGRWLKRHAGVSLGVMYRLFCIVISIYLPLVLLDLHYDYGSFQLERELRVAAILLGVIFTLALVRRYFWEFYFEQRRGITIPKYLRDVFALIVFLTTVAMVLSGIYGQNVTGVILPSTVLVGIIGWAMQDLLGNIISGISLQLGKPFKHGDWLIVDNTYGEVIEVNWRSTRLCTNDDIYLDVPNNTIVRNTIVNLSYPTKEHAMRIRLGIDYNVPPNRVKEVLVHATATAPGVMASPAPKAFLVGFGDSAVTYEIKYYLENHRKFNETSDNIHTNVWYALSRAGIRIPFPIRTLQIEKQMPKTERQI